MSVSAADTSNSTLSIDETAVQTDNNHIQSTTNMVSDIMLDTKTTDVAEKSVKSTNDNANKQSEKIESKQINAQQSTNTINSITSTNTSKTQKESTKSTKKDTKENVTINLSPVTTKSNETVRFNVTFNTKSNQVLNQIPTVLKVNGKTYAKSTIINGVAEFTLHTGDWTSKNYDMLIKVGETSTTLVSEKHTTLTITRRDYKISLPDYTTKVNSTITITAKVTDTDGKVVNNVSASFKINNKTIENVRVVNGVAKITYKPSLTYAGVNTLLLKVGENSYYNFGSISSTLTVITTSNINTEDIFFVKRGNQVTFKATVKDAKGNLLENGKVAFKINGKTIDTVSVVNGVAQVTYNNSKSLGNTVYNITIKYSGNVYTTQSTKTTYLRVLNATSKYSHAQILAKADDTKKFIEEHGRLPNFVTIGNDQVSPTDFFYLLCEVYAHNSSFAAGNFIQNVQSKTNCNNEKIYKEDYIALAKACVSCYAQNGRPQLNLAINGKTMNFADAFYFYTRAVAYIKNNDMCSLYGTVITLTNSSTGSSSTVIGANTTTNTGGSIFNKPPAGYESYTKRTNYCQVNSTSIRKAVNSAISGVKGVYNQAVSIFNYVRDITSYSGYYNTRYGAEGTLSRGYGNCCDMANLVIAMMRTVGIPARYNHATCSFNSGLVTGHVWAEVYVNGAWYKCDATSNRNSFGVIRNWYKCGTIRKYTELPF